MSEDPLERRRRQRDAASRRNLSIAIIGGGLLAAGLLVVVVLVLKRSDRVVGGTGETNTSDGNVANSDGDRYLFEMVAAWDRAQTIRAARPGNDVAAREGDESWTMAVKAQTGKAINKFSVRISRIVEEDGIGAFIEESVAYKGDRYRFFLRWAGPIKPLQGHEQWLRAASKGDRAVVSGRVEKVTAEEETWFGDLAGSIDKIKGRQMILGVWLTDARISRP